jgi:hypothetical protein
LALRSTPHRVEATAWIILGRADVDRQYTEARTTAGATAAALGTGQSVPSTGVTETDFVKSSRPVLKARLRTLVSANVSCTPHQTPAGLAAGRELEARLGTGLLGLLSFSVALDDAAADMPTGGRGRALTECFIPAHPRTTVVPDLRDHAVRLMKRRGRHGLSGGCDDQSKSNSDEPNHCSLRVYPFVVRRRPATTRGWTPQRVGRARRAGKRPARNRPHLRLDGGDHRCAMWLLV